VKLSPDQFQRELVKMVESPAWPELSPWFVDQLVRRVLASSNPTEASEQAAHERAGAAAFLLAIENEVTRSRQEAMHATRINRGAATAPERSRRRPAGDAGRAGGARKQAGPKAGGTG
jgi:hypothetical protein